MLYTVALLPRGEPISIEGFVRSTGTFSGGTWQSAIEAFWKESASRCARCVLRGPKGGAWCEAGARRSVTTPTWERGWFRCRRSNPLVVLRSAAALDEYGPDFRYAHHAEVHSALTVAGGVVGVAALVGIAQIPPAKRWLLSLKRSGEGPSESARARATFSATFRGKAGSRTVVTRVRGGDPGYTETAKMLAESGLCLSLDADVLPARSGVFTPTVAMGARLTERLQRAGIVFEVLRG